MNFDKLLLILVLLSFCSDGLAQRNKISIKISTEVDTVLAGQAIPIDIQITNISEKQIRLTKDFTFASNIFPNPVEQISKGARLLFNIEPSPFNGNIWIENQLFVQEIDLQTLEPAEYITLHYDLNKHLMDFVSIGTPKPISDTYRISLTYEFRKRRKQANPVTGTVVSNTVTIWLKR